MRLTADENRDAIKRYSHLRPARGSQSRCSALCPGTRYLCTLEMGHRGPHASHGALKRIKAVWDSGSSERLAEASASRATGGATRRPSRTGSPVGFAASPPACST